MAKIHVGKNVLDHQLLDRDGRRCGNVDDVAIEEEVVVAIFSGPGVWPQRAGWIGRLAGWMGGSKRIRIPWEEVAKVDSAIHLKRTATEYGLARGDDRLRPYLEKIPGADR